MTGQLDKANAALRRGDHATALRLFRSLADQGSALAQCALGFMYLDDEHLHFAEARKLFRLAADQGFAEAQYQFGVMCWRWDVDGLRLLRLAAEQGHIGAQCALGRIFAHHVSMSSSKLPQDYAEAVNGIAAPQTVANQVRSTRSAPCISKVRACRRTMSKHICGLAWRLHRVYQIRQKLETSLRST